MAILASLLAPKARKAPPATKATRETKGIRGHKDLLDPMALLASAHAIGMARSGLVTVGTGAAPLMSVPTSIAAAIACTAFNGQRIETETDSTAAQPRRHKQSMKSTLPTQGAFIKKYPLLRVFLMAILY